MQRRASISTSLERVLTCIVVLVAAVGCAPQRMAVTDPDDLARFAEASKASAIKRASQRPSVDEENDSATAEGANASASATNHVASNRTTNKAADKAGAKETASKAPLDAASRAFLDRIAREQSLDAETVAQYEELLGSLTPEMRAIWVAGQEALAERNKGRAAAPPAPRELPPVVDAEPITPRQREAMPVDYKEPLAKADEPKEKGRVDTAQNSLLEELKSVKEELARLREEQKEREAAELARDEAKQEAERQKLMLEALRGQGAIKGLASDDDVTGALTGLSTNFVHAEVAAAMAKANANKSDKPAPRPGEESNKSAPPPPPPGGARLEQLWSQIVSAEGEEGDANSLSHAMRKRLFLLAAGDANAASTPPEGLTSAEKEYWKHLMRVLELSIKLGEHPRRDRQAALVNRALRDAAAELETASVLDLQNAVFCSSVQAFGNYVEFEKPVFRPNQEVILYVELQNFASRLREDGKAYETDLRASYQILDSSGKRVADLDLPPEHGVCRQRRRDYFLAYPMHLPKSIGDGEYVLQLTMEDKISGKFGQTTLKFTIRE